MYTGLTEELCQVALEIIRPTIEAAMEKEVVKRKQGCLIVLDPTKPWEPKYKDWRSVAFQEDIVLFMQLWDDDRPWDGPFGEVALSKAFASWKTGLSGWRIQQECPYLYEKGWTKWGGSAVAEGGLVTSFSGVEAYFDQMISEMDLAAIKGVCMLGMHHKETGVMNDDSITFLVEPV